MMWLLGTDKTRRVGHRWTAAFQQYLALASTCETEIFNFSESYSVERQHTRGRWRTTAGHTHDACRHTLTGRQRLVHSLVSVDVMTHWRERAYRGAINTITWTENTEHWRDCALIQSKTISTASFQGSVCIICKTFVLFGLIYEFCIGNSVIYCP